MSDLCIEQSPFTTMYRCMTCSLVVRGVTMALWISRSKLPVRQRRLSSIQKRLMSTTQGSWLKMVRNIKSITINALSMSMCDPVTDGHVVSIYAGSELAKASEISYDKQSERASFKFSQDVPPSDVVLSINFTGTMNSAMAGFYRSKYKPAIEPVADTPKEDDFYYMLSTQFESCDARRAFPCFDEPNLKSTFDFEIEVPKGQTALSNMPVKSERDGNKPELKFVTFERTPVMSTYVSICEHAFTHYEMLIFRSFLHGQSVISTMSKH